MEWIKTFEGFLYEYIDKNTLRDVERYLDQSFKKIGMDIEFTKHFHDRLNDERNKKEITTKELIDTFNAAYREIGPKFANYGDEFEAVLQDMKSDINIPFILNVNPKTGDLELVTKTIMRNPNFLTRDQKIKVNK